MIARKAWDHLSPQVRLDFIRKHGLVDACIRSDNKAFNAWRRAEQKRIMGQESLTQAISERDYLRLRAHFEDLSGRSGAALMTLLKHADEAQLCELFLLEQACAEARVDFPDYPTTICRRQYKCSLEAASCDQLRRLLFTVRKRGFSKKRKPQQGQFAL